MLYLDLDRLKAVNDYLGHNAGDWFIRVFAERLREKTGDRCLIARLGGDEFVVVPAAEMGAESAEELAEHLQNALRERVAIDGEMLTRTVSIGVAVGEPGRDTTSDLLRKADQAVLNAKSSGGNKIAVFSDDMAMRSTFRNDIELHLQGVIDSGALVLHYLPEIDMRTGEVMATEALVRWQHPTRGLLLPDSFIGVAESVNLAGELGRWVIRPRAPSSACGAPGASERTRCCGSTCHRCSWSPKASPRRWPRPSRTSGWPASRCAWRSPRASWCRTSRPPGSRWRPSRRSASRSRSTTSAPATAC